ncbi:WXG100 family type VII secretion target [Anaerobacterium chartisolvens]|uniref:ESAT-6-like protein n=1 Tax=Anaerobacterium chartisolvens TaxID=1297424 RepID=A0A369AXT0_9FIRM|nr:WXG100 family type VII secretion target [Anaerobacterium chartisolvens]RCX13017.1 WXG100 family type VII secretion target [Anaerobacterium chartisolvens]
MATGTIRITPEQLRSEAKRLQGFNDQHQQTFDQMGKLIEGLRSQWEGQAVEAFQQSFNSAKAELNKFKVSIDVFVANMNKSAQALEDTDRNLGAQMKV